MASFEETIRGLGVDASGTATFTIPVTRRENDLDRIVIVQDAGDATSVDYEVNSSSGLESKYVIVSDTAAGTPVDEVGDWPWKVVDTDSLARAAQITVQVTANGGSAGGNDYTVILHFSGEEH